MAFLKRNKFDKLAELVFMEPLHFVDNLQHNSLVHKPPANPNDLDQIVAQADYDVYKTPVQILQATIKFASIQMAVEPYLRSLLKQHFYNTGCLSTEPTETGAKELDVFHPSYRVKRIKEEPVRNFENDDRMLDILQNEKRGYITVRVEIREEQLNQFFRNLQEKYSPAEYPVKLKTFYDEMLRSLLQDFLMPDVQKEVKEELAESAENFVISQCQQSFQ